MSRNKSVYESSAPVSKMLPASNIYRVGDYVYVETQPSHPYQIRRIEELTKTVNGQVEAKVSCFYRRRDLSSALVSQADKHALSAEEDGEIDIGQNVDEENQHQLKHREVFLSRQLEIINANTIRGKCCVTLYCEIEKLTDYIEKDDWFYYLLVYDPQQKTLLADRGEIGIGEDYQAVVPNLLEDVSKDDADLLKLETLVWKPDNLVVTDKQVDQFLVIARSVGTFARALDCGSSVKEAGLHLSAAAASRDITLFHAMSTLHNNEYDVGKAVESLIPEDGPVLCRDEMEEWSSGEAALFEEAVKKYGKEFGDIQQEYLPWKRIPSLVEYYYMWKTTDKYVQQKRLKSAEGDSKVTQIFIPSSNTAINLTLAVQATTQLSTTGSGNLQTPNYICESCFGRDSLLWYPWGPSTSQCKLYLCKDCWVYWKKYGGLKKSAKADSASEISYKCKICNKKFNRAERLSSHMATHKAYKCNAVGCGRTFDLKAHLSRHLANVHSIYPEAKKLKVKTPFHMWSTPLAKISRYVCKEIVKLKHRARVQGDGVNLIELKAQCQRIVTPELAQEILDKKKPKVWKPIEDVIQNIKRSQKNALVNIQKQQILSSPLHPAKESLGSNSGSSQTRKLLSPSKSIASQNLLQTSPAITANLKTRSLKSPMSMPPSTAQKRPLDVALEQNGIEDGPSAKRQVAASSPLGRKGYECNFCGKVLDNQGSLTTHLRMQHLPSANQVHPQLSDSNRPRYQAYCEVSPAVSGTSKIAPYAHHTITTYRGPKETLPNGTSSLTVTHIPHQSRVPPLSQPTRMGRSVANVHPQKRSVIKRPPGHILGKDADSQYVDPPQEFLFLTNKRARKARRSLPHRVQRKIARRPFIQIKCSQELRDTIICAKGTQQKVGNLEQPIVIDDD